ncbi:MAG: AN1-type zinc finger protein [Candidatus Bathyarchaeia archaeon]
MPQCEHCGKEVILPYKCGFCGHYFCVEHRLPENHNCPNLSFKFQREEKVEEQTIEKERIASEGELHFVKEPIERQRTEEPKPKGKMKHIAPIFCILLILAGYAIYSFGYNTGSNTSFNTGYDLGYAQGYVSGNLTGFELGYRNGNSSGYIEGYNKGYLDGVKDGARTGYNIRDPTYQEMLDFIALDKTDENEYSENYTCLHFTADVKNNAFKAGYRCEFVYIELTLGAHAIVCFNTTDRGIIFIEPQTDEIVNVAVGEFYESIEFWY